MKTLRQHPLRFSAAIAIARAGFVAALLVAVMLAGQVSTGLGAGHQPGSDVTPPVDEADPIIDNGTFVQMGIHPEGHLNVPGGTASAPSSSTTNVGLRYIPTNGESTAPGCLCEGWGVANADAGTGTFSGYANVAIDGGPVGLVLQSTTLTNITGKIKAESLGSEFKSIVKAGPDRVQVTHDYRPSTSANLYEVVVTIENIGADIGDLRYRRVMDWDISPFTFSEHVEIHVGTAADLSRATTDGFDSANPLTIAAPGVGAPPTTLVSGSPDYFGGPTDQGALFDFTFGALAAGDTKEFRIYYGAGKDRPEALAAVISVGAEVYSFGIPRKADGTASTDGPHAFIFAFKGVGGVPVVGELPCVEPVPSPLGWTPRAPVPIGVEGATGVIIGSKIYVTHGFLPGDGVATQIYDIPSNTWDPPGANAAVSRSELAGVCAIEDGVPKVFAIGGRPPQTTVEVYDPGTDTWTPGVPMLTARRGLCATYVPTLGPQGTIFAIGGGTGGTVPHSGVATGANEAYSVAAGVWAPRAPMPTPMMGVYACLWHPVTNLVYVFGGFDSAAGAVSNLVQRYDPVANTWLVPGPGAPMPTARSNAIAGICDNDIYVIGGLNPGVFNNRSEVERYDPIANAWAPAPPLPSPRSEMASTAISTGKAIYAIGSGAFGLAANVHDRFECGEGELVFEKTTDCPTTVPISDDVATECSFTITFTPTATTTVPLIIVDTVPAEWDVTGLTPSPPTTAISTPQGAMQKGSTLIEWSLPVGTTSATLTVNIATRESNGRGHKTTVFKPTSCGELPINTGAEAFEDHGVIGTFEPLLDVPSVAGPTNKLATEAVAGSEPCEPEGLEATTLSATSVSLSWTANPEDDGLDPGNLLYYVYRDGARIATVTGGTTYTDSGLPSSTQFCYQVNAAFTTDPENDGNHSDSAGWPLPTVDLDCDGFDNTKENVIGTDPLDACADDASDSAWPADVDNDGTSDIMDIAAIAGSFGQAVPAAPARHDVAPDGFVDIPDIVAVANWFGHSCTN